MRILTTTSLVGMLFAAVLQSCQCTCVVEESVSGAIDDVRPPTPFVNEVKNDGISKLLEDVNASAATTGVPTGAPTTILPTNAPTTILPTNAPTTIVPTNSPTTIVPTSSPTNIVPTSAPTTQTPTPTWTNSTEQEEGAVVTANNSPAPQRHVQYAIRAGETPSKGVNLGGWLVSEHWMTQESDIWKGLTSEQANSGEQTAFKNTERDLAISRFKWHRDNFITEDEIATIAKAGLNTVRVPVGYWIIGYDAHDWTNQKQWQNYAPGGLDYLDKLIRIWGRKHNVAVLISMHAAKGSQNGADHSSPETPGKSFWSQYPENIASTLDAVTFLAKRYQNEDAFLGIGLLNEPGGSTGNDVLYKYYEAAYQAIRVDGKNDCILTIAPLLWEQGPQFMTNLLPDATNVWVEWHRYFVWGFENTSEEDLLGKAITQFRTDVNEWKTKSTKKMFIGEFSFATMGRFQDPERLKLFGREQMGVMFEDVQGGWTFWSWRIYGDENGVNPWSLRNLLRNGIFPAIPT